MTRNFIEKAAADTREVVQSLIDENFRLSTRVADLMSEMEDQSRRFSERYVEVEDQNTKLANLYVASYQLNGTLDRQRVIDAIKEIVINLIGCEELAIWELDDHLGALVLAGSFGLDVGKWASVPLGTGVVGRVAASGERFVADIDNDEPREMVACIPLKLDDRVVGAIGIFSLLAQKQGLEPVDYELFDLLASHAASSLFCTSLLGRQQEQTQ
jgi:hypothetical protein